MIDLSVNQDLKDPVLMYVSNNGYEWEKREINIINHFSIFPFKHFEVIQGREVQQDFKFAMIVPEEKKQEDEFMTRNEALAFCIYNKVLVKLKGITDFNHPGYYDFSLALPEYEFIRIKQNGELDGEPKKFLKKYLNQTLDGFNQSL